MLKLSRSQIAADRAMPNLEPFQFWGVVRAIGEEQRLRDWVSSIPDPVEQAFMSAALDYSKWFEWNHPFIKAAQQVLEIPDQELRDLWLWGASIDASGI